MKFNIDTLAIRPAIQAVGILATPTLQSAASRFLPGLVGTAAVVGAGYWAARRDGATGRFGQGVLAATAAGLLAPYVAPLLNLATPAPGAV